MKKLSKILPTKKRHMLFLTAAIGIAMIVGGDMFYRNERNELREQKHQALSAISYMKSQQLVQWIKERTADANSISRSKNFISEVEQWLVHPQDQVLRNEIVERLISAHTYLGYEDVFLASAEGKLLISIDPDQGEFDFVTTRKINETLRQDRVNHTDFYYCPTHEDLHFDLFAPIVNEKKVLLAVLVFRTNPRDYLYPTLQSWPTPSATGEAYLVRLNGDSVVFVSDTRHRSNTALNLRFPLTQEDLVSVQAALGYQGIFTGKDYRGVDVLADIRPVPGTAWVLIAKADKSEIYASLDNELYGVILFELLLIGLVGVGLMWIYHYRQKNIFQELYTIEKDLWQSQTNFKSTLYSIGEGVITADPEGRINQMNQVAELLTGWGESAAKGKPFGEVYRTVSEDVGTIVENPLERSMRVDMPTGLENHTILLSREGRKTFISDKGAPVKDEQGNINGYVLVFRDETEKRQQLALLTESEKKYRFLFANNPQPMWIYDLDTLAFLEVNQAAVNHYGYSKEEFLSMTLKDIRPAEDIPALLEDIKNTRSDLNSTGEWRHLKKNGEIIDVEITSHSVLFNDRNARHILINDITERKFFETELLKLSRAVEQSPASVIITDLQGNMEYVNPKTLEITGYTKEELIGKNPRIFNSGEKKKEEYKKLWATILSGKEWHGEFHNKKKNGELYWESASISPILNEKQEIINFLAIKEDITERKRFDDTRKLLLEISQLATKQVTLTSFLAEVHQKIKQIIRADNFYVALYNETDNTFSFPYHVDDYDKAELNKAYDFSYGYTDYVLKSNQSLIISPEFPLEIEKDRMIEGYGNKLSVWLGVPFKITEGSKPNGVIAIQDYKNLESYTEIDKTIMEIIAHSIGGFIERIMYMEELVQAKEKAEESDRLKSAFLANMSHEIRTPMNGILGFTNLLLEPDLSSDEKEDFIKIIHQSGQRMLNTVNDIVEVSKIEVGLVNVIVKDTDLNERIEGLFRFFQPEAEKKGLKLILEMLLPAEKKNLSTDRNKFDSILSNLIKNAIKYTESGTIKMGCRQKDRFIEFYIKDTGIGIPTNRVEAIFNRFEQADIEDKRVFEGSGLGLSIAKSYVEMLGGNIWVESIEGKGTTFYFTLPAKYNIEEKSTEYTEISSDKKKKKPGFKKLKILIAEDDETSRNYISLIVNDFSAEILEAGTGIEALELCRNTKGLDLILMDIKMPGMDGYEATRRIREFNKEVIIIAQTAYGLSGDREKSIESGCNDYIAKPVNKNEFLTLIQKYFGEIV